MRESPQLILTVSQRNALLEGSIVLRQKFVQKLARKPMPGCVRGSAQGLSERTAFTGHGGGGGGSGGRRCVSDGDGLAAQGQGRPSAALVRSTASCQLEALPLSPLALAY